MDVASSFTADEWELVAETPRWVVAAASAAQPDTALRTGREREHGFLAIALGRDLGSPLVAAVAEEYVANRRRLDVTFAELETGLAVTLDRVGTAVGLLIAKAEARDARAYERWLVDITDAVITAAPSGAPFVGTQVTAAEKAFRDRLWQTIKTAMTPS